MAPSIDLAGETLNIFYEEAGIRLTWNPVWSEWFSIPRRKCVNPNDMHQKFI